MAFDRFGSGDIEEWSRSLDELMDEMLNRTFVGFRERGAWQPAVNIYETADSYFVCADLAGVSPDSITLECIDSRRIVIHGARSQPRPAVRGGEIGVYALEIDEGQFHREILLPDPVRTDGIQTAFDKGFLWVTLPRVMSE